MRHYLLLIALLLPIYLFSQPVVGTYTPLDDLEKSILTCTKRKPGLYKTFEEFKSNSPSVTQGYLVSEESIRQPWGQYIKIAELSRIDNSPLLDKDLRLLYWGVCFNDSIYVNSAWVDKYSEDPLRYYHLEFLGRYCFISALGKSNNVTQFKRGQQGIVLYEGQNSTLKLGSPWGGLGFRLEPNKTTDLTSTSTLGAILNINNGNYYDVTEKLMRLILAKDAELKKRYKDGLLLDQKGRTTLNETVLNKHNMEIIRQYNQTHGSEAKLSVE